MQNQEAEQLISVPNTLISVLWLVAQLCPTLHYPMDCSLPGSSVHGDCPGKNYWSGLPCPPPRDLPNPGIEPRSPVFRQILYCLTHQGNPRILNWVTYPFSRDLPNPGIKLGSPALQVDSLPTKLPGKPKHIDYSLVKE